MYTLLESLRCNCPHVDDEAELPWYDERQRSNNKETPERAKKMLRKHATQATKHFTSYLHVFEPEIAGCAVPFHHKNGSRPRAMSDITTNTSRTKTISNSSRDAIKVLLNEDKSDVTEETVETEDTVEVGNTNATTDIEYEKESDSSDDNVFRVEDSPAEAKYLHLPLDVPRWSISHPTLDFTGKWSLTGTDPSWKSEYDKFLACLKINRLVRKVAVSLVHRSREEIVQSGHGRRLTLRSINPKGTWERTLIASGASTESNKFDPFTHEIKQSNGENVTVESWWESGGTVHRSWMRGAIQGDYESLRSLENGILLCQSNFYRKVNGQVSAEKTASITWHFQRIDGVPKLPSTT